MHLKNFCLLEQTFCWITVLAHFTMHILSLFYEWFLFCLRGWVLDLGMGSVWGVSSGSGHAKMFSGMVAEELSPTTDVVELTVLIWRGCFTQVIHSSHEADCEGCMSIRSQFCTASLCSAGGQEEDGSTCHRAFSFKVMSFSSPVILWLSLTALFIFSNFAFLHNSLSIQWP